jgi:hypothetical protein
MMFMITMPPTTKNTDVIQTAIPKALPVIRFHSPVMEEGAITAKLSSS